MSFTANPNRWWGCASAFKPKSRQADGLFDVVVFVRQYLKRPCRQTDRRPTGCCDHRAQTFKRQCFQTNTEPRLAARSLCASVQTELFSDRQKALSAPPPLLWGGGHVLGWLRFQACLLAQHCPLCSSSLGSPASQALSPWQPEPDSTDSPFSEASVLPPNGGIWEAQAR